MRELRAGALLCAVLASACSSSSGTPAPRHEVVIRETADPAAIVQPVRDYPVGHLLVRILTVRCGIGSIVGTHAEFTPDRPLCDVRVRVRNDDATFHSFALNAQRLGMSDRSVVMPASDVMHIRRQQDAVELGAGNVIELDLWFEPPTGMRVQALRLFGDTDADPAGSSVRPASAPSVLVPLILG